MSLPRTEALYYALPDLDEAEAGLLELGEGGRELVLDRSLFFPEGGGQPCDLGSIEGIRLEWVRDLGGRQVHRLAAPLPEPRSPGLTLRLDRARRRDHSEQHSAQHLLSALLFREHGIPTLSFHLGAERSTIDVDLADFPPSLAGEVEAEVNRAIGEDLPFRLHLCPPEDPSSLPLRRAPPSGEEVLRIWEIVGLDYSPCCGTHLERSSALRLFSLHQAERYKGKTRLHFSAGGRAIGFYLRLHRSAREAGRVLSAPLEELGAGAEALALRAREAQTRAERLLELLVAGSLDRARGSGPPLFLDLAGSGAAGLEAGLRALRAAGLPGVVSVAETATVLVFAPAPAPIPSSLAGALETLGGRGGGARGLLRASLADPEGAGRFAELALAALREGKAPEPGR